MVSVKEPLSIVQFAPISTPSSKTTVAICGVLKFFSLAGIKPKPYTPILDPAWTQTSFDINEFFIVTSDPIIHF